MDKITSETLNIYASPNYKDAWPGIAQTGGEIARVLLIEGIRKGYNTVLDSTGGGFATASDTVTVPLMQAAKESGAKLQWVRVDVPVETAIERIKADFKAGKKAMVDDLRIQGDVQRAQAGVQEIIKQSELQGVPVTIATVGQDFVLNKDRSHFPSVERAGGAISPQLTPGQGNPGQKQMRR